MDFIAIDFETANRVHRGSVCAVGLVVVKQGIIVDEFYSLVNPLSDFDPYCVQIHGITEAMVQDAPTFKELWSTLGPMLDHQWAAAHNASFDMNVLEHCISAYELPSEGFRYVCSYLLAKRIWPELSSYRLNDISRDLKLDSFRHHDALEDARAAALVLIKCLEAAGSDNIERLAAQCEYRPGIIYSDGMHIPFASTRRAQGGSLRASHITPNVTDYDKNHKLYRKHVVFSGTLGLLSKSEAMQKVVDAGGLLADQVRTNTHYLVVGSRDYKKHLNGTKSSSKIRAAEQLAAAGRSIKILPEEEFLPLLET